MYYIHSIKSFLIKGMRTELSVLFREKKTKEVKESWRKKFKKIEVKELQDYSLSIFNFCNMVIKKAV